LKALIIFSWSYFSFTRINRCGDKEHTMLRVFCHIKKGKPFELSLSVLIFGPLKTFHFPSFGGDLKGRPTKKSRFLEVPY